MSLLLSFLLASDTCESRSWDGESMQRIVPRHCRERAGLDFDLPGCTSPLIPAALAPPFPLIVTIIIPATCCDPVRFMSSTSSHAIAVVVVVRIIIVAVLVAVMVVAM
jgi:hypothetical protein